MNNQSAHKGEVVRGAIAAAATRRLLLPLFSPDLNPIENASATFKATLPKAPAWTIDDLISAIRYVLLASHQASAPTTSPPLVTSRSERYLL